jgi:hypothetical protein
MHGFSAFAPKVARKADSTKARIMSDAETVTCTECGIQWERSDDDKWFPKNFDAFGLTCRHQKGIKCSGFELREAISKARKQRMRRNQPLKI